MNTTQIGRIAEAKAADYLRAKGFMILQQNWRARYCEIDIVAAKNEVVYFVEVKYRQSAKQGSGLEYITKAKVRQMSFAARLWAAKHGWPGQYSLAAIAVSEPNFTVTTFVENFVL